MSIRPDSIPAGPEEPYDLNTSDESFLYIEQALNEYGDIVRIPSKTRKNDSYLINKPEYIKHILLKNYENYKKGVGFERVKMLLGNGIIVSDGEFWRKQRRMIQPSFSRKMIESQIAMVQQCNLSRRNKWKNIAEQKGQIDISFEASDLALDIILRLLFSDDVDELINNSETNPFAFLTEDTTRDIKVVLKFRALTQLLLSLIQKRRSSTKQYNDFLSVYIEARDKESGEGMTDKVLLDELMTLIIAGHETSAITLTWVWYFIAKYPDLDQLAIQEIVKSQLDDGPSSFAELELFPCIKHITEEALRMYPPVWLFSRKAIDDDMLDQYQIPAGADIFISPYYLHRNDLYWQDAETFDPKRFTEQAKKQQHKFSYIPFSAGPRRCIGDFFAIVEMQIHVAIMAPTFKFELMDNSQPELEAGINMRAKNPILLKIRTR